MNKKKLKKQIKRLDEALQSSHESNAWFDRETQRLSGFVQRYAFLCNERETSGLDHEFQEEFPELWNNVEQGRAIRQRRLEREENAKITPIPDAFRRMN